jgi:hypothetical protein
VIPARLYIKEHRTTGLKYFGKSTVEEIDSYKGSGKRWTNHIKVHGPDIITTWVSDWYTNKQKIKSFAVNFSRTNDIVNSDDWANLIEEDGLDGGSVKGRKHTPETRKKMRDNHVGTTGMKYSEESKKKMSESHMDKKRKPFTAETRKKMSEARMGKKASAESKKKMSESGKLGWKKRKETTINNINRTYYEQ